MKFLLALAAFFLLTSASQQGCKSKKTLVAKPASEARSLDFLQKKLTQNLPKNAKTLSAKAKINFESETTSLNASANVIWVRDSMLWVSVKKFGIEGARALLTRDSVFLLNRLEKTYSATGWERLQSQYHLPAGFELVENLIFAEAWLDPEIKFQTDVEDGLHKVYGKNHRYAADYRIEEGTFRVRKMTFLEQPSAKTVTFAFDGFQKSGEAIFLPYLRSVTAFDPETGAANLEISLSDVEINVPKNWRFEIPAHYKKVD